VPARARCRLRRQPGLRRHRLDDAAARHLHPPPRRGGTCTASHRNGVRHDRDRHPPSDPRPHPREPDVHHRPVAAARRRLAAGHGRDRFDRRARAGAADGRELLAEGAGHRDRPGQLRLGGPHGRVRAPLEIGMTLDDAYATRLERLRQAWHPNPDKPEESPENTLLALGWTAAGAPRSAVAAAGAEAPALDGAALQRLDRLLASRIAGVPLAHLTGRQHFLGLELLAGPDALIPRKETELLARAAIDLARDTGATRASDPCTGSGNLALALAHHVEGLAVHGSDLSATAVALARRNAAMLGLEGRVDFRDGDLLAPFDTPQFHARVDLVVCNPPYISSAKVAAMAPEISGHEPRLAFDGGTLGVSILTRLMHDAPRLLRAGGWLAFEVGRGQGAAMARRLGNDGAWDEVRECTDGDGAVRVVLARRSTDEGEAA